METSQTSIAKKKRGLTIGIPKSETKPVFKLVEASEPQNVNDLRIKSTKQFGDFYHIGSYISQGTTSTVRKATRKSDNMNVAVKLFKLNDPEKIFASICEFRILSRLNHPSIIHAHEMFINEGEQKTCLVLEHFIGKTLGEYIVESRGGVSESQAVVIFKLILEGISYLHSKEVVHRDINPGNILISPDNTSIKIIDFNVAKFFGSFRDSHETGHHDHLMNKMLTLTGNINYAAPEMVGRAFYDEKVDLWSAGVILYEMLYGFNPMKGATLKETIHHIIDCKVDYNGGMGDKVSLIVKDLIRKLLTKDPSQRLNADEALKHPWFQLNKRKNSLFEGKNLRRSASIIEESKPFTNASGYEFNLNSAPMVVEHEKNKFFSQQNKTSAEVTIKIGEEHQKSRFRSVTAKEKEGPILQEQQPVTPKVQGEVPAQTLETTPKQENSLRTAPKLQIQCPGSNSLASRRAMKPPTLQVSETKASPSSIVCPSQEKGVITNKRFMEKLNIHINPQQSSEIMHFLDYSKHFLERIQKIKRDRSRSAPDLLQTNVSPKGNKHVIQLVKQDSGALSLQPLKIFTCTEIPDIISSPMQVEEPKP